MAHKIQPEVIDWIRNMQVFESKDLKIRFKLSAKKANELILNLKKMKFINLVGEGSDLYACSSLEIRNYKAKSLPITIAKTIKQHANEFDSNQHLISMVTRYLENRHFSNSMTGTNPLYAAEECLKRNQSVLYISDTLNESLLSKLLISLDANISFDKLISYNLTEHEIKLFVASCAHYSSCPLVFIEFKSNYYGDLLKLITSRKYSSAESIVLDIKNKATSQSLSDAVRYNSFIKALDKNGKNVYKSNLP